MRLLRLRFLRLFLAGISFFTALSCKTSGETNNTSTQSGWFDRAPSSMLTLPVTNERIDVRTYRIDPSTEAMVKHFDRFDRSAIALHLVAGLKRVEAWALYNYSGSGYDLFKEMFRNSSGIGVDAIALFKATISAVNAMPTYKGPVYFGQAFPLDYVTKELKVGTDFFHNNFTSTSMNREIAKEFIKPGSDKEAGVLFQMEESCNGAYLGQYSFLPREREVIFRPLHPFRIIEKVPPQAGETYWVIKLKESQHCPANAITQMSTIPHIINPKLGENTRIYADPTGKKLVAILKAGAELELAPVSKKGSRFEVFLNIRRKKGSWECLDTQCFKQRMLAAPPEPLNMDDLSGAAFETINQEAKGVAAVGLEMFGGWMDQAQNREDPEAVLHGYVEESDVIVPK